MTPALEATGLGVRYRRTWALRDCSLAVPAGRVAALVGPNGAGKTTLMHAAVGLLRPARGSVRVAGEAAFVAQDKPLYDSFTVAEMLAFGRRMNRRWDGDAAAGRLGALGIPLDRKVSGLSGGQQAQVAVTLALAVRPDLLVLDEPLANLDPLARHDVMRSIMAEVAERELTVLLSSHVVSDLEETCDWLVVLNGGRLQVSGDIEELLDGHRVLTGPDGASAAGVRVVSASRTGRQVSMLVRGACPPDPRWRARRPGLEELVMGYLRSPESAALPDLTGVGA
ncbi:Methionine ABC transporter ATP-binding protein [[Actinomadura] parvosata subsp. kistnae]|uniref:ABC transporter ATP-binding protein n=1 Tax=[Actinomadura] parvosata subsp. kistnae TaxID=1909395 RepID=A0A1V0AE55_9ACTN|nr:ABC transporter ATP-binding protein [Nonomuraea sp. ATCC 55076]AQZ68504.1 ABC transporter ATP-binding protein [Nonomuraea sp. ATCC 55076]SPL93037.1 Methionine ABC transporter ATP-binding protein [Actinomadura parvosata subsp. kistnae]